MADYNSITDLLPKKIDYVIILFQQVLNTGHWCTLIRTNNKITFFDSYGLRPDKELLWTKMYLRHRLGQDVPHLSILLNDALDDKFKVVFNEIKFQDDESSTCGRYCIAIVLFYLHNKNPTITKFYKVIMNQAKKHQLTFDLTICRLI